MPNVITARDLKAVQKIPFCYICGEALTWGEVTRDHVPPRGCFALVDSTQNPIILPTHALCNNGYKVDDEAVGQYLSLLHGKKPKPGARGLHQTTVAGYPLITANKNVNLYGAVERWVRAFHAALYQQPLPRTARFATELPIDVASAKHESGPEFLDTGRPRQRAICEKTIADSRATRTIDRIVGWNGRLQYECVWVLTPLHAYCVFWIDLYDWRRLARVNSKLPRECVGYYQVTPGERPVSATLQSRVLADDNPGRFLL